MLIKNSGRGGGVFEEEAWEGEGRRGNVCGEGGGAEILCFGAETPTKDLFSEQIRETTFCRPVLHVLDLHELGSFVWPFLRRSAQALTIKA